MERRRPLTALTTACLVASQRIFDYKLASAIKSLTSTSLYCKFHQFLMFYIFVDKWPPTASGLPSTAGTTASCAFLRRGKLYIGHCGDSGIVLGRTNPKTGKWIAQPLTTEHKPESPEELQRIESCGGKVQEKQGTARVVWYRPKNPHQGRNIIFLRFSDFLMYLSTRSHKKEHTD